MAWKKDVLGSARRLTTGKNSVIEKKTRTTAARPVMPEYPFEQVSSVIREVVESVPPKGVM